MSKWPQIYAALACQTPKDLVRILGQHYMPGNAREEQIVEQIIMPTRDWRKPSSLEELLGLLEQYAPEPDKLKAVILLREALNVNVKPNESMANLINDAVNAK